MLKALLPILCLFVLSPLVAEYLSGSLPAAMITILPLMAAMYGSAALLIREIAVRTRGGWPAIVLLGAAYGFVEEGWVDQSLFNPDFQHLRLLDYGYVAALGTGLPWLIYVIAIHVVWSIATPIALTNCLFPARRQEPWLARWGMALFALLYFASSAAVARFSYQSSHFFATQAELVATGILIVALVAAALLSPRWRKGQPSEDAPAAPLLFVFGFVPGALLVGIVYFGRSALHLAWQPLVAILILVGAMSAAALVVLQHRHWSSTQYFALTAGLILVYLVSGFLTAFTLHGAADLPGHLAFALICVAALGLAWRASAYAIGRADRDPEQLRS